MAAKTYHMFIGDNWVDAIWPRQGQWSQRLSARRAKQRQSPRDQMLKSQRQESLTRHKHKS